MLSELRRCHHALRGDTFITPERNPLPFSRYSPFCPLFSSRQPPTYFLFPFYSRPFLDFSCKWTHAIYAIYNWLLSLSTAFSSFIYVITHISTSLLFIVVYHCAEVPHLFICSSVGDIQVVSTCWILRMVLLWTLCTDFYIEIMFSVLLGIYLAMALLGRWVTVSLWGTAKLFHFPFSSAVHECSEGSSFLHALPHLLSVCLIIAIFLRALFYGAQSFLKPGCLGLTVTSPPSLRLKSLGPPRFLLPTQWPRNSQGSLQGSCRAHFVCFLFLWDHCPLSLMSTVLRPLFHVFCLGFFVVISGERVHRVTSSWPEVELIALVLTSTNCLNVETENGLLNCIFAMAFYIPVKTNELELPAFIWINFKY